MTLEDELLAVEGVTDAIVATGESGPIGIQVEVAPGSDRDALAAVIARILDARGLNASFPAELPMVAAGAPGQKAMPPGPARAPVRTSRAPDRRVGTVAVSENDRGVRIAIRLTDGVKGSTESPASEDAIWQSLAELLYDTAGLAGPRPLVETVEWLVVGQVDSVVVVVQVGRHRRLGAAPATATRPLAVGRAIWAALI